MARSFHVTRAKAVKAVIEGDEDIQFHYGHKRNVKALYKAMRKDRKELRKVAGLKKQTNSAATNKIKRVMKRQHK